MAGENRGMVGIGERCQESTQRNEGQTAQAATVERGNTRHKDGGKRRKGLWEVTSLVPAYDGSNLSASPRHAVLAGQLLELSR